jgi:hypothetical protein
MDWRADRSWVRKPRYTHPSPMLFLRPAVSPGRPGARLTSPEMAAFGDAPLVGPGSELQLTSDGQVVPRAEVLADGDLELVARAPAREEESAGMGEGLEQRNLFAVAEQLAARAATPSTRRQYAAIYRSFGDWLRGELRQPPVVSDLNGDLTAAYARYLETAGGRGGRPAALATRRIYLSMVRALMRGCPRSRRTSNGGPFGPVRCRRQRSGCLKSIQDRRNRREEGTRAQGRHDR